MKKLIQTEWLIPLIAIIATVITLQLTNRFPPRTQTDIAQKRVDSSAIVLIPNGRHALTQTFTPRLNGLSSIELKFGRIPQQRTEGRITVQLTNAADIIIHTETFPTTSVNDGDTRTFSFSPQRDSAGQTYTVLISGQNNTVVSVCGYPLPALNGTINETTLSVSQNSEPTRATFGCGEPPTSHSLSAPAESLYISTESTLTWRVGVREIGRILRTDGALLLFILIILPAPGMWLVGRKPSIINCALALCIGIVVWSTVWLWWSLIAPLPIWFLWLIIIGGWFSSLIPFFTAPNTSLTLHPSSLILLSLVLITFVTRLLTIRHLAFPPWVDSSHHALITQVMVINQRMLRDFQPLIDFNATLYHTGLYPLPTTTILLTNSDLPRTLLILGQLVSTLIPLTTYAGTLMISKRRTVALLTAFIVALPTFFPGYYPAWGRLTQLTGMLILPVLMGLTWKCAIRPVETRRTLFLQAGLTGLLAAGLFLIHVRVFIFYVPFALTAWAWHKFAGTRALLIAGLTSAVIALPRIIQLAQRTGNVGTLTAGESASLDFPNAYFNLTSERWLFAAVILSTILVFITYRWHKAGNEKLNFILFTLIWTIPLLILPLIPNAPRTWVIDYRSHYIMLYLPMAMVIACGLDRDWRREIESKVDIIRHVVWGVMVGMLIGYTGFFGVRQQSDIIGDRTILAEHSDLAAMAWLDAAALPYDTLIVNEAWVWINQTWAAEDGSAWILPLTGYKTTTPPHDYDYQPNYSDRVPAFNREAERIDDWSTEEAAEFLRTNGVTHVYIGNQTGRQGINLDPLPLSRNPALRTIYAYDGAFIFEVAE